MIVSISKICTERLRDVFGCEAKHVSDSPKQVEPKQYQRTSDDGIDPVSEATAIEPLQKPSGGCSYQNEREAIADTVQKQQQSSIQKALFVSCE